MPPPCRRSRASNARPSAAPSARRCPGAWAKSTRCRSAPSFAMAIAWRRSSPRVRFASSRSSRRRRSAVSVRDSTRGCGSMASRGRSTATSTPRSRAWPPKLASSASASSSPSASTATPVRACRCSTGCPASWKLKSSAWRRWSSSSGPSDISSQGRRRQQPLSPPPVGRRPLMPIWRPGLRRRFLATEVVQTSAMDCGPAALKCLLEGFRVPASYARLQEACQTDVDGTSINTIERSPSRSASTPSR